MRYKSVYIVLFIVVLVGGVVFLLFNRRMEWFDDKDVTVITSLVALLISIIALALADQKLKKFRGCLEVQSLAVNSLAVNSEKYYMCRFKLINLGKDPIVKLKVDFRFPDVYNPRIAIKESIFIRFDSGIILRNDQYRFIGTNNDNNFAVFKHSLGLDRMKESAYITIHAENMEVKTFVFTPEMAQRVSKEEDMPLTIH